MALLCHIVLCLQLSFGFEGGRSLEYGLHNMAERCNHQLSQCKNLLHTSLVFSQSQ